MQEEITNMRNISKRGVQWTRCGRGAGAAGAVRVQSVTGLTLTGPQRLTSALPPPHCAAAASSPGADST